jgi:hypothetical protein
VKKRSKVAKLIAEATQEHRWQQQAALREHLKTKPATWDGVDPMFRVMWKQRLQHLEIRKSFAEEEGVPALVEDSSGWFIEWAAIQAAQEAAINRAIVAKIVAPLRRSPGRKGKPQSDASILKKFAKLRAEKPASISNKQIREQIGRKEQPPIKESAVAKAITRAKKRRNESL